MITPKLLQALNWCDPDEWSTELETSCLRFDITNRKRVAMFLANTGHESNGGRSLRENLNYTPSALVLQWPRYFTKEYAEEVGRTANHPADQKAIAEAAYNGRMGNKFPGDGWAFIGRGLMQTTGRYNYEQLAKVVQIPLADIPPWLETKQGAAESAACYWFNAGCNELADTGALDKCRLKINGGLIGIRDVRDRYLRALAALA
jgi:putative chitinase